MRTLNTQRSSRMHMTMGLLSEQFAMMRDQLRQLMNEIVELRECAVRRSALLDELRHTCVEQCAEMQKQQQQQQQQQSIETALANQYNVYYWLFQQQPQLGHLLLQQSIARLRQAEVDENADTNRQEEHMNELADEESLLTTSSETINEDKHR
jgi:predicted nucleic acid-binding Zn ribbon protein